MRFRAYNTDGTTFGMEVDSSAVARMQKKSFLATVKLKRYALPRLTRCVHAKDVAAIMGAAGWLCSDFKNFERIAVGEELKEEYAVIYEDTEYRKIV